MLVVAKNTVSSIKERFQEMTREDKIGFAVSVPLFGAVIAAGFYANGIIEKSPSHKYDVLCDVAGQAITGSLTIQPNKSPVFFYVNGMRVTYESPANQEAVILDNKKIVPRKSCAFSPK
jgi:hypothetical protein